MDIKNSYKIKGNSEIKGNKEGEVPVVFAVATITVAVTLFIIVLAVMINMLFTPATRQHGQPIGSNVVHYILPRFIPPTESVAEFYIPDSLWQIEAPTYNDEIISIEFINNSFIMVTETIITDADMATITETLNEIQEFYIEQGGNVEILEDGENNVLLRVTMDGSFILTENELWLIGRGDILTVLPFSWDEDSMTINNNRFVQILEDR